MVKTDDQGLSFLSKGTGLNARLTRWAIALGEYNLEIEYVKSSENGAADYWSRPSHSKEEIPGNRSFLGATLEETFKIHNIKNLQPYVNRKLKGIVMKDQRELKWKGGMK